jgi:hypothetical protein
MMRSEESRQEYRVRYVVTAVTLTGQFIENAAGYLYLIPP